jgi:hypothetical protein
VRGERNKKNRNKDKKKVIAFSHNLPSSLKVKDQYPEVQVSTAKVTNIQ